VAFGAECTLSCADASFALEGPATGDENTAGDNKRMLRISCGEDAQWSRHERAWCRRLNDAPRDIILSGSGVVPEETEGALVGTLVAVDDMPADDVHRFAVVALAGDDGGLFAIMGSQLVLVVRVDYESGRRLLAVTVRATDSYGASLDRRFEVAVKDLNEAPTRAALWPDDVSELALAGTVVGLLTAEDPDAGDSHSFALVASSGLFDIDGARLLLRGSLDYETAAMVAVDVRVTDSGSSPLHLDVRLTVRVSDRNEPPTALQAATSLLKESAVAGAKVADVQVVDEDNLRDKPWLLSRREQAHTLAFCDGTGGESPFRIEGLTLYLKRTVNYEATPTLNVCLVASDDGGLTGPPQTLTIFVQDVLESPQAYRLWPDTLPEMAPLSQTAVGMTAATLEAYDEDIGEQLAFTLLDNADGLVALESEALCGTLGPGEGSLPAGLNPGLAYTRCVAGLRLLRPVDYEVQAAHNLLVRVRDAQGQEYLTELTLLVADVNEAPAPPFLTVMAVREGSYTGQLVAELAVRDPDRGDTHSFAITSQTPPGAFAIAGSELSVADSDVLDYEQHSSVRVVVIATDSGSPPLTATSGFDIAIMDVNERATAVHLLGGGGVMENATRGTVVGQVVVDDPDTLSWRCRTTRAASPRRLAATSSSSGLTAGCASSSPAPPWTTNASNSTVYGWSAPTMDSRRCLW